MDEHASRVILKFPDASLCYTILEVCVDSTERECLALSRYRLAKEIVSEATIVSMIVMYEDSL